MKHCFLIFTAMTGLCFGGEIDLSNFTSSAFWTSGGKAEICEHPTALQLDWVPNERKLMECNFQSRPKLGTFQTITMTLQLEKSEKSTLLGIGLRLIDKEGEIFQFRNPVKKEDNIVVYRIDTEKMPPFSTWKANADASVNRKLDFPVDLVGVAIDYPAGSEAGTVKILSISYEKFPEEKEAISVREGQAAPLDAFQVRSEGGAYVYEDTDGIIFPRLRAGQFRLRLKADAPEFESATLTLLRGKKEIQLTRDAFEIAEDKSLSLIFPVTYHLDAAPVTLKKISVKTRERKPVLLLDIVYETPHVTLKFAFGKGSSVNVWQQGRKGMIEFHNPEARNTVSGKATLSLRDPADKELWGLETAVNLAPGETISIPVPEPARFGLYQLSGILPGANSRPIVISHRIAYMPANTTAAHDEMQYGIALMTHPIPIVERGALAAQLCGADFIRSSIIWMYIERTRGDWNWKYTDEYYKALKDHQLRWAPILWCPPRWATAADWKPSYEPVLESFGFPLPDYECWETYVRNSVNRYGKDVRVMEIWNEAELPGFANFTPEEYAELLKRAYAVIKKEHPQIRVSTCGYTCLPGQHPRMTFPDFMPRSLKAAKGSYDIHSIHLHNFFPEYVSNIKDFLRLRKEWGVTAPWAANETAMTSTFCSRQVQAEVLFEKMVFSQAYESIAYVWHNMIDLGRDQLNKEHNFGLLDNALEPKEAYLAFNTVTRLFRGAKFQKEIVLPDCYGYIFRKDDIVLFPIWTLYPPAQERLLVIGGITGSASRIDVYGNSEPLKVINGKLVFHASPSPVTLRLEQTQIPKLEGELFVPGKEFGVFLLNAGNAVRSITGRQGDAAPARIAVKNSNFSIPLNPETIRKSVVFKLDFDTIYGNFSVQRYITPQFDFPARSDFNRPADFSLQDQSSYTPTSPNDPSFADSVWKNAADCSVRAWFGWKKPDRLLLKVAVRDDIHFQDQKGIMIYQGDGLQLFFSRTASGGMWKLGMALDNSGNIQKYCWIKPPNSNVDELLADMKVTASRNQANRETVYLLDFSAQKLGVVLGKPFRFNLLVNDNDGRCRVGYHSLTEVTDNGDNDRGYPIVTFKK